MLCSSWDTAAEEMEQVVAEAEEGTGDWLTRCLGKQQGALGKLNCVRDWKLHGIVFLIGKAKHFDSDLCWFFLVVATYYSARQHFNIHADDALGGDFSVKRLINFNQTTRRQHRHPGVGTNGWTATEYPLLLESSTPPPVFSQPGVLWKI